MSTGHLVQTHEADQQLSWEAWAAHIPMLMSVLPRAALPKFPLSSGRSLNVNAKLHPGGAMHAVRPIRPALQIMSIPPQGRYTMPTAVIPGIAQRPPRDSGMDTVAEGLERLLASDSAAHTVPPEAPAEEEPEAELEEPPDEELEAPVPLEEELEASVPLEAETEVRDAVDNASETWTPEKRAAAAAKSREHWKDPEYRKKVVDKIRAAATSEETKQKLSVASKRAWAKKKAAGGGTAAHSEERKAKIAAAIRAKWADPEYRNKVKKGMKTSRKSSNSGARQISPEARAKISETLKNKWRQDEEFRSKMLAANEARQSSHELSSATRQKISETMKAKWQDDAYRESQLEKFAAAERSQKPRAPRKARAKKESDPVWQQKKAAAGKARERELKSVKEKLSEEATAYKKKSRKSDRAVQAPPVGEDAMQWYMKQVGKRDLLTPEEVNDLAKEVQKLLRWKAVRASLAAERRSEPTAAEVAAQLELPGGAAEYEEELKRLEKCKESLVLANIRLVYHIAKKYQNMGLPMGELVQEGTLGLITAVERYDWTRGFKLSTSAFWWIRQSITRALAQGSRTIRLPVHVHDAVLRARQARRQLTQALGREPHDSEVAKHMGIPLEKLQDLDRASMVGSSVSLNAEIGSRKKAGNSRVIGDMIKSKVNPAEELERRHFKESLNQVLDRHLDERERLVVRQRFGLIDGQKRTLQEIGSHFNVSRERVRQIETSAFQKLRSPSVAHVLRDYLGQDGQDELVVT